MAHAEKCVVVTIGDEFRIVTNPPAGGYCVEEFVVNPGGRHRGKGRWAFRAYYQTVHGAVRWLFRHECEGISVETLDDLGRAWDGCCARVCAAIRHAPAGRESGGAA